MDTKGESIVYTYDFSDEANANRAYIATYDPPTVTAMLDVVAAAQTWAAHDEAWAKCETDVPPGVELDALRYALNDLAQVVNERSPDE